MKYYPNRQTDQLVSRGRSDRRNAIHAKNLMLDRDSGREGKRQCPFCLTHRNHDSTEKLKSNTLAKHVAMCPQRDNSSIQDPSIEEHSVDDNSDQKDAGVNSIVVVVTDSEPKQFFLIGEEVQQLECFLSQDHTFSFQKR